MKLTLKEKKQEINHCVSFIFEGEESITWHAGQFLVYTLPHESEDERGIERYFTISAAPHEGHIILTTRFSEESSSFKNKLQSFAIGDTIDAEGPDGDFVIDDPGKEFVFIAGGIGITPFRSILLDLDKKGIDIRATLLYGNKTDEFVFKKELDALSEKHKNFKIQYIISPEVIDEAKIKEAAPNLEDAIFYVSGPEPMVEHFEKILPQMGIPEEHIKRDHFPGYSWP